MSFGIVFLILAVLLFAIAAWSRWWPGDRPYHPAIIAMGLFFWSLSQLWPQLGK